jgi:hypothetical protein
MGPRRKGDDAVLFPPRRPPAQTDELRGGVARKGIAGDPPIVIDQLERLRDEAVLDGVSAEINPGTILSHEQALNSLRLYCQEVMPYFK